MRQDHIGFRSSSGGKGSHSKSANIHIGVLEDCQEHRNQNIPEHSIQDFVAFGEGVSNSLNSHSSNAKRLVLKKSLDGLEGDTEVLGHTYLKTRNENCRIQSDKSSNTFSAYD